MSFFRSALLRQFLGGFALGAVLLLGWQATDRALAPDEAEIAARSAAQAGAVMAQAAR
ncbi:hypothetical protein GVO57_01295 [Sphingomonas changnyeongensis]|uniref:Uncharacterized protein n=1 Tax=Sphingomonas changnyeongensis TaxID=2698679 RepID=A0A7Z2NTS8_9SPHN|nr:hypothetical protein [Sphingomonas changnyeongensis]QHL89708.1 hypothetical protein GVO57_01295 [Sphingomonas changnyeongensis]